MDTDRFIVHVSTEDIYEDIAKDFKKRPLSKVKIRKFITLMEDELRGKIMKEVVGLKAKRYATEQMIMIKVKK